MAFNIVIKTTGLANLPEKIKRFRIGVLSRISMMLALIGEEVVRQSREEYLSGPRPEKLGVGGNYLRRSVNYKVSGNRVVIGSNLRYARIHELGGTIVPKSAPYLHFKVGSNWVKTKRVVIPARPFLRPALGDSIPGAKRIIARLAGDALKEAMA